MQGLKGSVSRDFAPSIFSWFKPTQAPDKQAKVQYFQIRLDFAEISDLTVKVKLNPESAVCITAWSLTLRCESFLRNVDLVTLQCDAYLEAWLRGVMQTEESDSALTPQNHAHYNLFLLQDSSKLFFIVICLLNIKVGYPRYIGI